MQKGEPMRLIDADRLLDRCKFYHLPNGDLAVPIIDVQHAPTIEPEQPWIPVSERPPEKDGMYYVTVRDSKGDIDAVPCLWSNDKKWMIGGVEVIAWIKIPAPYRGE